MEVTGEVHRSVLGCVCGVNSELELVRVFEEYVTSWSDLRGFWFLPPCCRDGCAFSAV